MRGDGRARAPYAVGEPNAVVAVTGAGSGAGAAVLAHLAGSARISPRDRHRRLPGADGLRRRLAPGRRARPGLDPAFAGVTAVAHLAVDLTPDADRDGQRQRNTRAAQTVLTAAFAAGVRRVVVVGSALAYGAYADNPVPLADDAPLRAVPEASAVGDLLEIERIAASSRRSTGGWRSPSCGRPWCSAPATGSRWRRCWARPGCCGSAAPTPAGSSATSPTSPPRSSWPRWRRPASSTARPTWPATAGSTTTSWSGSVAGAAWSCPSGSRSGWRNGCTGSGITPAPPSELAYLCTPGWWLRNG